MSDAKDEFEKWFDAIIKIQSLTQRKEWFLRIKLFLREAFYARDSELEQLRRNLALSEKTVQEQALFIGSTKNSQTEKIEELSAQLNAEQIYAKEKDHTATVFMNQVKRLHTELQHIRIGVQVIADDVYDFGAEFTGVESVVVAKQVLETIDKALQPPTKEGK